MPYPFEPSGARGAEVDARVRASLAQSLGVLAKPIVQQQPEFRVPLERSISALLAGPVYPGLFALYSDLVEAIYSDDEPRLLSTLNTISALRPEAADHDVRAVTLSDDQLGSGMAERFLTQLDDDPDLPIYMAPISDAELDAARSGLANALALLDSAAFDLGREIRSLIRDVVFVASAPNPDGLPFHGASSFYLWGAVFLNAHEHSDRLAMAEGLTHEAAHNLLHGYTLAAPLVENPKSERFHSPLRADPRPMDGIVHAAYVLARMHYCVERLQACEDLTASEREYLEMARRQHRSKFFEGLQIVDASAKFTPAGRAIFEGARSYMMSATAG